MHHREHRMALGWLGMLQKYAKFITSTKNESFKNCFWDFGKDSQNYLFVRCNRIKIHATLGRLMMNNYKKMNPFKNTFLWFLRNLEKFIFKKWNLRKRFNSRYICKSLFLCTDLTRFNCNFITSSSQVIADLMKIIHNLWILRAWRSHSWQFFHHWGSKMALGW